MSESATSADVIFIGIAGPSGCGKSTYARHLADHLRSPCIPIQLDHFFFKNPPIIEHPILGRIESYEEPRSLNIQEFSAVLHQLKRDPQLMVPYRREGILANKNERMFIIVEGFLLFALSDDIINLLDIKIFLDSSLAECRLRRFRRRSKISDAVPNETVQVSDRFQQWFDHLVWEEYLKRRDLQMTKADKIFPSKEYHQKQYTKLDDYIAQRVKELIEQ